MPKRIARPRWRTLEEMNLKSSGLSCETQHIYYWSINFELNNFLRCKNTYSTDVGNECQIKNEVESHFKVSNKLKPPSKYNIVLIIRCVDPVLSYHIELKHIALINHVHINTNRYTFIRIIALHLHLYTKHRIVTIIP